MSLTRNYKKNIACLESLWDENLETPLKIVPILEMAARLNEIKFTHLTCNTREELKFNLNLLKKRRGYGILYFAFHGDRGEIQLAGKRLKIETLALYMDNGFEDWVVHFGSCSTLNVEKARLKRFVDNTRVSLIVGYRKDPFWAEGTALDLLALDWLHAYKDMHSFWLKFKDMYGGLISRTGFVVYPR